jgi:hypothetical protein
MPALEKIKDKLANIGKSKEEKTEPSAASGYEGAGSARGMQEQMSNESGKLHSILGLMSPTFASFCNTSLAGKA